MGSIPENMQAVKSRIDAASRACGRDPRTVRLLAVSKTHAPERVREACAAGQRAFGENYVQEALDKMAALADLPLEWHLVGPLQSNKTRAAAERFDWVHTIDREKVARRLSEQRPADLAPLQVLVQVNVSGEASKSGVAPAGVAALARAVSSMPRLRLRGLMAIPEPGAPAERYHELGALYERLRAELDFDTLSLGMSDDMETAIAAGSTMVRIGTAIFGERAKVRDAA
ncbi:MAG: YggS family pyridoxal phosphate-dependent enzyme [Betaproteobacteria bacterium]|nr:YggS family pyridoxal phosphate-dependent enzyme [Betaproteobacteria bacterium]MDH5220061.1 YggS family pyridoxal phosphate-dependent enzyme [Betaproteobacteria bacterium]MDH5349357.1 YggS family pyridoxal phosphate-dependent enzyme [Betaproteobacteria bacterium]